MAQFELRINGQDVAVDAPEQMPLLWVLRDLIGLKATRFGCGRGLCGACTVHVDGKATRSCLTPAAALAGSDITTLEGLDDAHPVLLAWAEMRVPQCGYCQSGQMMSAAALLADNPNPAPEQIAAWMNGNLCRCGTYLRIRRAVARAAEIADGRDSNEEPQA
jgi:isoquinoline 1-oxidoreductase alpha subunit